MVTLIPEIGTLLLDTSYSWVRMLIALGVSFLLALAIGIAAARSKLFGKISIPIIDILQTLPILAFFPVVIYLVIVFIPGIMGINAAVIFLIVTSMLWNMIFGVYEAVKSIPNEFVEMGKLYGLSLYKRLKDIYIPASLPRLSEQMNLSWAIGLFYLVTSEIFSTGVQNYQVKGIGVDLANLGFSGNFPYYLLGIIIFVGFVIITKLTLFAYFEKYANRFSSESYGKKKKKQSFDLEQVLHHSKTFRKIDDVYLSLNHRIALFYSKNKKIIRNLLYVVLGAAIVVIASYVFPALNIGQFLQVPSYFATALVALLFSFIRVWGAFLAILVVAIPVGIYVAFRTSHKNGYMLVFQVIASIPATILLPLLVFEIKGDPELVAFIVFFLSGIWYVIFSIVGSTRDLPKSIEEVRQIFRVKGWNAWKKIYLKAIAPGLITGAITGIAAEWNASIVAEQFSAGVSGTVLTQVNTGIGKLLDNALTAGNLYLMLIALICMTAMIILLNTFVWKRLYDKVTSVYT